MITSMQTADMLATFQTRADWNGQDVSSDRAPTITRGQAFELAAAQATAMLWTDHGQAVKITRGRDGFTRIMADDREVYGIGLDRTVNLFLIAIGA
tara:strand:- start:4335 stop:4622 length:288 start_codon:yes stop_codon:yes gene_type:complete